MNAVHIALAIILHPVKREVLIARRKKGTHLADYWEFPGGKVEENETPAQCAVREAQEEVGLRVAVLEEWETVVYEYPERTVALHPFVCRADSHFARPQKSEEIAWVGVEGLCDFVFPPANAPILAQLKVLLTPAEE